MTTDTRELSPEALQAAENIICQFITDEDEGYATLEISKNELSRHIQDAIDAALVKANMEPRDAQAQALEAAEEISLLYQNTEIEGLPFSQRYQKRIETKHDVAEIITRHMTPTSTPLIPATVKAMETEETAECADEPKPQSVSKVFKFDVGQEVLHVVGAIPWTITDRMFLNDTPTYAVARVRGGQVQTNEYSEEVLTEVPSGYTPPF